MSCRVEAARTRGTLKELYRSFLRTSHIKLCLLNYRPETLFLAARILKVRPDVEGVLALMKFNKS